MANFRRGWNMEQRIWAAFMRRRGRQAHYDRHHGSRRRNPGRSARPPRRMPRHSQSPQVVTPPGFLERLRSWLGGAFARLGLERG